MKNYYITTLSKLKDNVTLENTLTYTSFNNPELQFSGLQTNEAPVKNFIWFLQQDNLYFSKMILLTTKECEENMISALGQTTYEYYLSQVHSYTSETLEKNTALHDLFYAKYESVDEYLNNVVYKIPISDQPSHKELFDSISAIFDRDGSDTEKVDLYMDFTGGSRIASMISLFLVRILEYSNAQMRKMVYANIMTNNCRIIDCTDNYRLCQTLEANVSGDYVNIAKTYSELGITDESDLSTISKANNIKKDDAETIKKLSAEESSQKLADIESAKPKTNSVIGLRIKAEMKKVKENTKNPNPLNKMLALNDDKLIVSFNEDFLTVLINSGLISAKPHFKGNVNERLICNNIKSAFRYYEYSGMQQTPMGVIPVTRNMLSHLLDSTDSPSEYFKNICMVNHSLYADYIPKNPVGISQAMKKDFASYMEKNQIVLGSSGTDFCKTMQDYLFYQDIYFNYGFPFSCADTLCHTFPEVAKYYIKQVKNLSAELSERKEESEKEYREELQRLMDFPEELIARIPTMPYGNLWEVDKRFFDNDKDRSEFLSTFRTRLETVRPYRNAVSHKNTDEYSKAENKQRIAADIRNWIREYSDILTSHGAK